MKNCKSEKHTSLGKIFVIVLMVFMLPSAVGGVAHADEELTVSAAASLTNAFREIAGVFEAGPGKATKIRVRLNFASSGALMQQISGGAPVDVFASAAQREMDALETKGLILPSTRRNFAANGIVLIKPVASKVMLRSFEGLKDPAVRKIAIGNPATVPAGMYAKQALQHYKLWDSLEGKVVFGEHVRQVLDYVARGEVDAGIVFSTDALVRAKEVVVVSAAPPDSHKQILYPVAVTKDSKKAGLGTTFIHFLVSPEAKRILAKHGFKEAVR